MKNGFRRHLALPLGALLGLALAAVVPLACFSLKEPPCAFSCLTPPHRCPEQYTCQADGLCHREGATGICTLASPLDAAAGDAQGGDAGTDLASGAANDGGDGSPSDAD